ncbi:hypothetical protein GCM10020331_041000 [Ectobacillus funiculus]
MRAAFGSGVLEFAHTKGYHNALVECMGIPDRFIEHGSVNKLLEEIGLTTKRCGGARSCDCSIQTKKGRNV